MELLISQGCSIQKRDDQGNTPLHVAVIVENRQAVQYLFNLNADIFARNKQDVSPLILIIKSGNEALDWFISPRNIGFMDNNGNTPLHIAARIKAPVSILQLLIDKGADLEARNNRGETAYDTAVDVKYDAALDVLLP